jgi:hypothetical protein
MEGNYFPPACLESGFNGVPGMKSSVVSNNRKGTKYSGGGSLSISS